MSIRPLFRCHLNISIVLLFCAFGTSFSSGMQYSQICPTNRIVQVVEVVDDNTNPVDNDNDMDDSTTPTYYFLSDSRFSGMDIATLNTTYFRECNCPMPILQFHKICPMTSNLCGVPNDIFQPVECYTEDSTDILVRNVSIFKCVCVCICVCVWSCRMKLILTLVLFLIFKNDIYTQVWVSLDEWNHILFFFIFPLVNLHQPHSQH